MRGGRLGVRVRKGGSALRHQLGSRTGCQPWALGCAGQSKMLCSHCSCWGLDLSGSSELPVLLDGSTECWVFREMCLSAQKPRAAEDATSAPSLTLPLSPPSLCLRAPHPPLLPFCRPHMPGHVEERSSSAHSQRAEGFPGKRADQILHVRWPNHSESEPLLSSPHGTVTSLPPARSIFPLLFPVHEHHSSAGLAASSSGMMDGPSASPGSSTLCSWQGWAFPGSLPLLPPLLAVSLPSSQGGCSCESPCQGPAPSAPSRCHPSCWGCGCCHLPLQGHWVPS